MIIKRLLELHERVENERDDTAREAEAEEMEKLVEELAKLVEALKNE